MDSPYLVRSVLLLVMIFGTGQALAADERREQSVEDSVQQWEDRYNAGDVAAVAEFYDDEAVFYTGEVLEGRQEIRDYLQSLIDDGFTEFSQELVETDIQGDVAYTVINYELRGEDGEAVVEGYSMAVAEEEAGDWKIQRTISNTIKPKQG